jgi:hypothetical protein
MADTKLTRIGNSPTVRGENGQIIATFFTENRYRLAGQMILIPEGIKLLHLARTIIYSNYSKQAAEQFDRFLERWDDAS